MKTKWYLSVALAGVLAANLALAQSQTGAWLRADQKALQQVRQSAGQAETQTWLPVVQEFKALIDNDPELYMLFTQMFEQIPRTPLYLNDPVGDPQVRNYHDMLRLIDRIITQAPEFNKTDLVGFPINAIVNWAMGTPAGAAAFLNEKVNRQLKKILTQ